MNNVTVTVNVTITLYYSNYSVCGFRFVMILVDEKEFLVTRELRQFPVCYSPKVSHGALVGFHHRFPVHISIEAKCSSLLFCGHDTELPLVPQGWLIFFPLQIIPSVLNVCILCLGTDLLTMASTMHRIQHYIDITGLSCALPSQESPSIQHFQEEAFILMI